MSHFLDRLNYFNNPKEPFSEGSVLVSWERGQGFLISAPLRR